MNERGFGYLRNESGGHTADLNLYEIANQHEKAERKSYRLSPMRLSPGQHASHMKRTDKAKPRPKGAAKKVLGNLVSI